MCLFSELVHGLSTAQALHFLVYISSIEQALHFLVLKVKKKKKKENKQKKKTCLPASLGHKAELCGDVRVNFKDTLGKEEGRNGRNSTSFGDGKFQKGKKE